MTLNVQGHSTTVRKTLVFDDVQYLVSCDVCGDYALCMDEASAEAAEFDHYVEVTPR